MFLTGPLQRVSLPRDPERARSPVPPDRGHGIVAMDLVQVYMVGLQTPETGLHTVHNVAGRSPDIIPPRRLNEFIGPAWPTVPMALKSRLPWPNVMVPKQSLETRRPALWSVAYSMMPSNCSVPLWMARKNVETRVGHGVGPFAHQVAGPSEPKGVAAKRWSLTRWHGQGGW